MTHETYRVLPCNPIDWSKNKPGGRRCESGLASLGKGQPYYLRSFPDTYRWEPYQYACFCGGISRISYDEFVQLPQYTEDQLRTVGLVTWEEHQLPDDQARDLIDSGFTPSEVQEMKRK